MYLNSTIDVEKQQSEQRYYINIYLHFASIFSKVYILKSNMFLTKVPSHGCGFGFTGYRKYKL